MRSTLILMAVAFVLVGGCPEDEDQEDGPTATVQPAVPLSPTAPPPVTPPATLPPTTPPATPPATPPPPVTPPPVAPPATPPAPPPAPPPVTLRIWSDAIVGGVIPARNQMTCDGVVAGGPQNISPALKWEGIPAAARSLAVSIVDLDFGEAPHWILYNCPITMQGVAEDISRDRPHTFINGELKYLEEIDPVAHPPVVPLHSCIEGPNQAGQMEYLNICPPPGETHRYRFEVYAIGSEKLEMGRLITYNTQLLDPMKTMEVIDRQSTASASFEATYTAAAAPPAPPPPPPPPPATPTCTSNAECDHKQICTNGSCVDADCNPFFGGTDCNQGGSISRCCRDYGDEVRCELGRAKYDANGRLLYRTCN